MEPDKPEKPSTSTDEWWATWHERRSQWQPERPLRDLLRKNPIVPALYLIFLCGFFIGPYISDPGGLGMRPLIAIPLGILTGAIVWWLLMLGFANGWVEDE